MKQLFYHYMDSVDVALQNMCEARLAAVRQREFVKSPFVETNGRLTSPRFSRVRVDQPYCCVRPDTFLQTTGLIGQTASHMPYWDYGNWGYRRYGARLVYHSRSLERTSDE